MDLSITNSIRSLQDDDINHRGRMVYGQRAIAYEILDDFIPMCFLEENVLIGADY